MKGDLATQQGFQPDRKVTIDARLWESLQRIVWRMKVSFGFIEKEALDLIASCRHEDGCRGVVETTEPCSPRCPDRQVRNSALLFLANAREFGSKTSRRPAAGYFPPTREFWDEVVANLAAAEAELREIRGSSETHLELPEVPSIPPKDPP